MSGFEVAGVVLGAIPLVVSGLELSIKGIGTLKKWRAYRRHITDLILDLDTEHCKLKNVLEHLLEGIVPSEHIESMIRDPFGPSWHDEDIQCRVQQRLWNSDKVFRRHIMRIQESVEELKYSLGIDESFTDKTPPSGLKAKFKQLSSFIVNGSACKDLLTRIKEGIEDLDKLMLQNNRLEPKRKANAQGRFSRLVREMSTRVHRAILRSLRCHDLHHIVLKLESRTVRVFPEDSDEDILQRISFALGILSSRNSDAAWEEVILRLAAENHASPQPPPGLSRPTKSARFATPGVRGALVGPAFGAVNLGASCSIINVPVIQDLCNLIYRARQQQIECCEGRISEAPDCVQKPRSFDIKRRNCTQLDDSWSLISLSEVLENKEGKYLPLSFLDKIRLASIISSSVIELQETPWMPSPVSIQDIYFISREDSLSYQDVFVISKMPHIALANDRNTMTGVQNPALVALGILLVELTTGQPISALRPCDMPSDKPRIHIDYENAIKQLDKISIADVSSNYASAARSCLRCELHGHPWTFEHERFRQYVYNEVVASLELDLSYANIDMT